LLSNAIKYSPPGSPVRVALQYENGSAILRVQDEGIGIPPEAQTRLFDAFHRAKNVGNIPGTGLGLAIVKRAVDAHGGSIVAESEAGKGTTFTVCLPIHCQSPEAIE
jgi:signal transduction histidine kinase